MDSRLRTLVFALWILAGALAFCGVFPLLDPSLALELRVVQSVYSTFQLFTLGEPDYLYFGETQDLHRINWCLHVARFLAPLVTLTTLLAMLSSAIQLAIKRLRARLFYRHHAIVYGFNLRGRLICEDLAREGIRAIVLDPDLDEEEQRWLRSKGILFFLIHGTDEEAAKLSKAESAKYLFAGYDDDSTNMKILVRAYQRNREAYEALTEIQQRLHANAYPTRCYVHFDEPTFKNLKFGGQFSTLGDYFALRIFSVYDLSAKRLALSLYTRYAQDALAGRSIHFSIIGFGLTGQAMLEQLTRMSYFNPRSRTTISIFAEDSESWRAWRLRYPIFDIEGPFYEPGDVARLRRLKEAIRFPEVCFHELPMDSALLASGKLFEPEPADGGVRIAILCLGEATRNLAVADMLLQQRRKPLDDVFVRADDPESEIRRHLAAEIRRKSLSAFPSQAEICTLGCLSEGLGDQLAQSIHEEYLEALPPDAPRAPSSEPWRALDEPFKESNRRAAAHIAIKLSLLGFHDIQIQDTSALKAAAEPLRRALADPGNRETLEILSECEHNRWAAEKLLDGWTPGKARDDVLKRHPNLVPWSFEAEPPDGPFAGYAPLTEPDKQKDRDNIEKIPAFFEKL